MPVYHGSCHCGQIKFEVEASIESATECNCSICSKKGILHHRVPPERFRILAGEGTLATYQFGTRHARHHFCPNCGIHVFTRPRMAPDQYTINVRCLDDFDHVAEKVRIDHFDGRNWK